MEDEFRSGIGRKLQESFRSFVHNAADLFDQCGFLGDCERQLREVEAGIVRPFNIAVFGRMKTGKSSLINALLGRDLAITGVEETTATVNVISHSSDPSMQNKFTVHWKNRPPETFPLERLQTDWSGKTKTVEANVSDTAFIQLYSDDPALALHEIIDTPGTGAAFSEHEKVAQTFLDPSIQEGRKADALVYVFGINGRETDEQNLQTFRNGCLPSSKPYNSVGVLHKWDATYWNSGGNWGEIQSKANRLREQMSSVVADVIPVSAPIASISSRASDEDLQAMISLISEKGPETIEDLLQDDEDWNDDEACRTLRKRVPVPWVCFRVAMREAGRLGPDATISALRTRLAELGGVGKLRAFLDRNFFKSAALIRQRQQYARFLHIKEDAYAKIEEREKKLSIDQENWDRIFNLDFKHAGLRSWMECKRMDSIEELSTLRLRVESLDSQLINNGIEDSLKDLDAIDWCESHPERISAEELQAIRSMADRLAGDAFSVPDLEVLRRLKKRFALLRFGAIDASGRKVTNHVSRRIDKMIRLHESDLS